MNALEVSGLWTGYSKGAPVLHGLDLQVSDGEVVAVIGPNGAGKTSLLRTVCGLLPMWRGTMSIWGTPMCDEVACKRAGRGIALVPEGARVFADLTVAENLAMGAYLHRDKPAVRKAQETVLSLFP